jgi:hypothetical protein
VWALFLQSSSNRLSLTSSQSLNKPLHPIHYAFLCYCCYCHRFRCWRTGRWYVERLHRGLLFCSRLINLFLSYTVVDRQVSVPVSVSCIIDENWIDILKRWGEPTTTITSSASWTPVGTTSYTTATVTSTATPFGGYCPCDSTANKKRFIGMS